MTQKKNIKKSKEISVKYLGNIYSNGSDHSNIDTFNVYSKSALFDYDNARELNKQCSLIEENFQKSLRKKGYKYFPEFFHDISIHKKNFFPHHWYMDEIGNVIDVNLIKHPDFGEGIIYSPSYGMFDSGGAWLNPSFIKNFIKIEKSYQEIHIDDNKLCFGFFDEFDLDYRGIKNFFKVKNKKNIKDFQNYIKEKYQNIKKNRFGSNMYNKNKGSCILECEVPNGKYKFYTLTSKKTFEDTSIEEGTWMGDLILFKK